jgi:hypothetical protein
MSNVGGSGAFGVADNLRYNEWYADSFERSTGTLNNPTFVFDTPLENIQGFKVLEVQIPFSYYVIDTFNNTFTLTEPVGGGPFTVTLVPGNYTISTMTTELERALDDSLGAGDYTVTYSSSTQRFTVTSNVPEAFVLTFGVAPTDDGTTNPRLWLGFAAGDNTATAGGVLVAPFVARMSGPDYLYLCSSRLGMLNNLTLRRGTLPQSGPIIARIPVDVNPGGVIVWRDPDPGKYFEVDTALVNVVDLYLVAGSDTAHAPLDLQGASFAVKLAFVTSDSTSTKRPAGTQLGGRAKRVMTAFM